MSHTALFETAKAEALAQNTALSETVADLDGTTLNAELHAMAASGAAVEHQVVQNQADLHLDTATGDGLDRLINDRYALQRSGGTASRGDIAITRVATVAEVTVAAGTTFSATHNGQTIKVATDFPLIFSIGIAGPLNVPVTSTRLGSDQNVSTNTATIAFDGAPAQADMTVAWPAGVTTPLAGGNDLETDEQAKERARGFWVDQRRGTLSAIERGSLQVDQVREASATNRLDVDSNPLGWDVVVADEDGSANAALTALVDTELDEWRPAGVPYTIIAGTATLRAITGVVHFDSGAGGSAAILAVRQAIVAMVNTLGPNSAQTVADAPAGSWLDPADLVRAAKTVPGVLAFIPSDPAALEKPAVGAMFRTNLGLVTVT